MSKKRRRLIAFIDYDNIDSNLRKYEQRLDFIELMKQFLEIGEVEFAIVFIPYGSYYSLPNINKLGFEIMVCQKLDELSLVEPEKREDKVDSRMAMIGKTFLEYKEITDVVFLTHDWHSNELFSECLKKRKRITFFANPNDMKFVLRELLENFGIEIRPLPAKPRLMLA